MDEERNFGAFILTHNRPGNVKTLKTLERCGYTGKVFLVVDDEDPALDEYKRRFVGMVKVFSKAEVAQGMDEMEQDPDRRTVVYARNACHQFAVEENLTHYIQLDDDYTFFATREVDKDNRLRQYDTTRLDTVFEAMCDFLDKTPALTVAFAQGGDYIGGAGNPLWWKGLTRKAMNSFICRTDRPFTFIGRINEDVNTYTKLGNRGELLFTVTKFCLGQTPTQSNAGGMTDTYLDGGTYLKTFPTVMLQPSSVKVQMMGGSKGGNRLHHSVAWKNTVPEILSEEYRRI